MLAQWLRVSQGASTVVLAANKAEAQGGRGAAGGAGPPLAGKRHAACRVDHLLLSAICLPVGSQALPGSTHPDSTWGRKVHRSPGPQLRPCHTLGAVGCCNTSSAICHLTGLCHVRAADLHCAHPACGQSCGNLLQCCHCCMHSGKAPRARKHNGAADCAECCLVDLQRCLLAWQMQHAWGWGRLWLSQQRLERAWLICTRPCSPT